MSAQLQPDYSRQSKGHVLETFTIFCINKKKIIHEEDFKLCVKVWIKFRPQKRSVHFKLQL